MQTSTSSAFRLISKNKDHHEPLHKRKYERVVSYVVDGQHFNANMLMLNGENRYFNPIKESFVNIDMSQTDSLISSLKHEFKPKVVNKIKMGEQTPFTQNEPDNYNLQPKVHKGVRYYNLKSLILPDESNCLPSIGSPQLPPKKPSPINLTSSKSLNPNKHDIKQAKKPKAKLISNAVKRENLKYDRESSKKLVENWLESIRPYYENKQISQEVTPPIDLVAKSHINPWSHLIQITQQQQQQHQQQQQQQQPPLPKINPLFRPIVHSYKVARPIFETFGISNFYNQISYFNNFGNMNYFAFPFRKF